ncbi:MAG: tetratricopeptide repeat protein, partial [Myxococcota bacterium]
DVQLQAPGRGHVQPLAARHKLKHLQAAQHIAQQTGDHEQQFKVQMEHARHKLLHARQPGEAAALLKTMIEGVPQGWNPLLVLTARALLGVALREDGQLTAIITISRPGVEQARRYGARNLAHTLLNNTAEALRDLGRHQEARQTYLQALEAVRYALPLTAYAQGNLALLDIAEGHHGNARRRLEELLGRIGGDRRRRVWLFLAAALQICLAADLETERWSEWIDALEDAAREGGQLVHETPALLRQAAQLWRQHQRPEQATRAETLAARLDA